MGLSNEPFMKTCLVSLPQRPHSRVRATAQSGAGSEGSGISRSCRGEVGPTNARGVRAESSFVAARRGMLLSMTRARMASSRRSVQGDFAVSERKSSNSSSSRTGVTSVSTSANP